MRGSKGRSSGSSRPGLSSRPRRGDSDCSDCPVHGKRLTAAGTAPDSERGSSPDSLLRLFRPRRSATLTRRNKVKHFFLSDNPFDDRFSSARQNIRYEGTYHERKGERDQTCPDCDEPDRPIITTPLRRPYLLYRTVLSSLPFSRPRSLPSPPRSAGANPCPTSQQASTGNSRSDLPAPYGRLRRRKPPEPRRNERRHRPENGNRPIKRKRQASARLAAFVRGRIAPRISYIPYPSSEIRSYTTLRMPSSRIPALQATRLTRV